MGIDYRAIAIIGLKIDRDLFDKLRDVVTETRTRGCEHQIPKSAKFCPECGAKAFLVKQKRSKAFSYDDADYPTEIAGVQVEMFDDGYGGYDIYVGTCVMSQSNRMGGGHGFTSFDNMTDGPCPLNSNSFGQLKDYLKYVFDPIGLWKDDHFGLHAVLNVS